jgi:hypothetical protein
MVGPGWQTGRAGAVAIRLPYGLELPISRREWVVLIDMRRLLKSVTGYDRAGYFDTVRHRKGGSRAALVRPSPNTRQTAVHPQQC